MSETKLSLEEVVFEFELWRSKKQSRNEKVPEELMSLIRKIKDDYPVSKISQSLKLGYHKLKNYFDDMEILASNNNVEYFKKIIPEIQMNESLDHKKIALNEKKAIVNIKMPNGYEITIFQPE